MNYESQISIDTQKMYITLTNHKSPNLINRKYILCHFDKSQISQFNISQVSQVYITSIKSISQVSQVYIILTNSKSLNLINHKGGVYLGAGHGILAPIFSFFCPNDLEN